jgi:hypothetical protein
MRYVNCPICRQPGIPVGGTECGLCGWKKKGGGSVEGLVTPSVDVEKQEECARPARPSFGSADSLVIEYADEVDRVMMRRLAVAAEQNGNSSAEEAKIYIQAYLNFQGIQA